MLYRLLHLASQQVAQHRGGRVGLLRGLGGVACARLQAQALVEVRPGRPRGRRGLDVGQPARHCQLHQALRALGVHLAGVREELVGELPVTVAFAYTRQGVCQRRAIFHLHGPPKHHRDFYFVALQQLEHRQVNVVHGEMTACSPARLPLAGVGLGHGVADGVHLLAGRARHRPGRRALGGGAVAHLARGEVVVASRRRHLSERHRVFVLLVVEVQVDQRLWLVDGDVPRQKVRQTRRVLAELLRGVLLHQLGPELVRHRGRQRDGALPLP
mmetsp:Transcript_18838/g.35904  ORF Transcript_18838/g.35904 Transcript_18838/m.35904 type:complete len:271 (-) Transcript_18838:830-1642(-)